MYRVKSTIKGKVRRTVRLGLKNTDFEIPLVSKDNGPQLEFEIVDLDGEPRNLDGAVVGFSFKRVNDIESVNSTASGCSITDAEKGLAVYNFTNNDLLKPGTYFGDLSVSVSGVTETAADAVRLVVRGNNK